METMKLDIACAALHCAIHNKTAVERYEHELSRINGIKRDVNQVYIPENRGTVKTHNSPYVRYK